MAAPVYRGNDNVNNHRHLEITEHNVSTNPFWREMTETARGHETNPFLTSMELTTARQNEHCGVAQQSWLLTPPPSAHTNPFIAPRYTAGGEVGAVRYRGNASVPASDSNNNRTIQTFCTSAQAQSTPHPLLFAAPWGHDAQPAQELSSEQFPASAQPYVGEHEWCDPWPGPRRAKSVPHRNSTRLILGDSTDSSEEECCGFKERIPTLRPGHFDGSGSWKDFIYQFERCAQANHWTEKTKAMQLRFHLIGAAGAIVHKNRKSASWSYERILKEVDAAYGPHSEHAAAIGIELRQRVRKPGEALHTLRDDIYEKVVIVYGDRTELEQDSIAVEIFTNAMTDADIIQKLLEVNPRTLARAYDIAHRHETTKKAARAVTQMMRPSAVPRGSAARTALVFEDAPIPICDQLRCAPVTPSRQPQGTPRSRQHRPNKTA